MDQPSVYFPLADDLQLLTDIRQIINAHEFTHLDVEQLSEQDILLIQHYAAYVLPLKVSQDNFDIFRTIAGKLKHLHKILSRFEFIIAPGDSPSKFINSLGLCKLQLPPVIQFPLSGLGEEGGISDTLQQLLDDYIAYILTPYNIKSTSKVVMFDYFSTGASHRHILKSMQKLLGPDFKLNTIPVPVPAIGSGGREVALQYALMIEGDTLGSRCVKKLPIDKYTGPVMLEMNNVTLCNTICLLVAITYYGLLEEIEPMPTIKIQDGIYTATYYIPDEISTGPIFIGLGTFELPDRKATRPLSSIIEIHKRLSVDRAILDQYIGQVVTVELLDGSIKEAYVGMDGTYTDLKPIQVDERLIKSAPREEGRYRFKLPGDALLTYVVYLSGQYYEYNVLQDIDIVGIV